MLNKIIRRQRFNTKNQFGYSLVELMVGITIGLFIVAATSLMISTQLSGNRRMLLETQLNQDLRATADIITRELRRASYAPNAANEIWFDKKSALVAENIFGTVTPSSGIDISDIQFKYNRRAGDQGPFGFALNNGVITSLIAGVAQALTDSRVMTVTEFKINLAVPIKFQLPCPRLCIDGTQACWPDLSVRTATVLISAKSVSDPNVIRGLTTQVRLKNDFTQFNGATVCPA